MLGVEGIRTEDWDGVEFGRIGNTWRVGREAYCTALLTRSAPQGAPEVRILYPPIEKYRGAAGQGARQSGTVAQPVERRSENPQAQVRLLPIPLWEVQSEECRAQSGI